MRLLACSLLAVIAIWNLSTGLLIWTGGNANSWLISRPEIIAAGTAMDVLPLWVGQVFLASVVIALMAGITISIRRLVIAQGFVVVSGLCNGMGDLFLILTSDHNQLFIVGLIAKSGFFAGCFALCKSASPQRSAINL